MIKFVYHVVGGDLVNKKNTILIVIGAIVVSSLVSLLITTNIYNIKVRNVQLATFSSSYQNQINDQTSTTNTEQRSSETSDLAPIDESKSSNERFLVGKKNTEENASPIADEVVEENNGVPQASPTPYTPEEPRTSFEGGKPREKPDPDFERDQENERKMAIGKQKARDYFTDKTKKNGEPFDPEDIEFRINDVFGFVNLNIFAEERNGTVDAQIEEAIAKVIDYFERY